MSKARILNNLLVESTLTLNPEIFGTLQQAFLLVQERLRVFASDRKFSQNMALAFGEGIATVPLQTAWLGGDVSNFPQIDIVSGTEINGAMGAYAIATNRIYLSGEFLSLNQTNPEAIASLLLEEYGHRVDAVLNSSDAPGDEGAIFSALVQGQVLSQEQLQQLKAVDDRATVTINGQVVQIEQASISRSGGVGGTTQTLKLEPLAQGQTEKNVTLTYSYEHFSIPDQFEVRYRGKPIFSTQRLVSGGKSDSIVFKQVAGNDQLDIVVTAPQSGTAWQFSVSTENAQINFNGLVGDVIKLDLGKQKGNLTLKSLPDASKGKLIDSKGENATAGKQYDTLFFVPKVTGAIQEYGKDRQPADPGLGQVTFDVEDQDQKSLTVKVSVTDGFSTSGDDQVTTGTDKIDIYRQQQRLAYLGFPGSNREPLVVDGQIGGNTTWAKKLFNIAVRPEIASARGRIAGQDDKSFKNFINSTNAPEWNLLNGAILNLTFPPGANQSQRFYGTDFTGTFLQSGVSTLNRNLNSTGVSQKNGIGNPSSTHDGGRSIDIDDIPGSYFFKSIGVGGVSYVAALGGGFVVKDGNTYRTGNPNIPLDVLKGVKTSDLVDINQDQAVVKAKVTAINNANLFVFSQTVQQVQELLDALSGSPRIFYNDPRFFDTGVIQYAKPHFDHIHFEIPIPQSSASTNRSLLFNSFPISSNSLDIASPFFTNSVKISAFPNLIEIGNLEDSKNLSGTINTNNPEQYYSFTIGSAQSEESYFTTPRDFNLFLNGLSGDIDVELFQDFSEDGIRQDGEIIASSTKSGNESETINLTNLDEGAYYLRIFQKSGDTTFNLSLTVPPLPVPIDNAGNTVTNAKSLGVISNNVQQSDFIGQVDTDDYYSFTLSSTSDLSVDVTGLSNGDLFAELGQDKNNDGILDFDEIIAVSDEEGDASEKINHTGLAAGNYVLHLGRNSGNTNYNLNLSATPSVIPIDKAGNTLATAFNLGSLTTSTKSDFVGNVDPIDYYRFSLTNPSGVTLKLSGLSADADLELSQDKNGDGVISSNEVIQLSEAVDNQDENIEITALAPGDYFVKVSQYDGDTNYNLSLTPKTAIGVDLQVTVTPITTPLILGDRVNYTVTVKNVGASSATGVILRDNLPLESVLNLSAVSSKGFASIFSSEIRANIGTLNVNESATLVVSGELIGSGPFSSLIQASSTNTDYNTENNSVVQRFNVASGTIQPADLELSLTSSQSTANINDLVTLRLTLTNKGPGAATSIRVKNLLAQGLTFVSSSPQQGSYNPVSGIWDAGNIASNNQAFVNIVARVNSGGILSNTAEVIAVSETDPDSTPGNNNPQEDDQASVTLQVSVITGTPGNDNLTGTDKADYIDGREGRDVITGGKGNDFIVGASGADILTGGEGNDQFVYTNIRDRGDTITDFEIGKDNIVFTQLLDSLVTGGYNGTNAIADGYVKVVQGSSTNNFRVQVNTDGLAAGDIFRPFITVNLTNPGTLNSPSNFVF
jgi:uncharacterized repeat protein (TIGR01451 family)